MQETPQSDSLILVAKRGFENGGPACGRSMWPERTTFCGRRTRAGRGDLGSPESDGVHQAGGSGEPPKIAECQKNSAGKEGPADVDVASSTRATLRARSGGPRQDQQGRHVLRPGRDQPARADRNGNRSTARRCRPTAPRRQARRTSWRTQRSEVHGPLNKIKTVETTNRAPGRFARAHYKEALKAFSRRWAPSRISRIPPP